MIAKGRDADIAADEDLRALSPSEAWKRIGKYRYVQKPGLLVDLPGILSQQN